MRVDPAVPHVVECGPTVETERLQHVWVDGRGGHHERVQRGDVATVCAELRCERFGGANDSRRRDGSARGPDQAVVDPCHSGVFVDRRTETLDGHCQSANQAIGLHQGAMLGIDASEHRCRVDPLLRLVRPEKPPLSSRAPCPGAGERRTCARQLGLVARERDESVTCIVTFDVFGGDNSADLGNGVVHRALQTQRRLVIVHLGDVGKRDREDRRRPSTVAPRCAEARVFAFQHNYFERQIRLEQVVGRPQAGEARTDDRHVGSDVRRQCFATRLRSSVLQPQRHPDRPRPLTGRARRSHRPPKCKR